MMELMHIMRFTSVLQSRAYNESQKETAQQPCIGSGMPLVAPESYEPNHLLLQWNVKEKGKC